MAVLKNQLFRTPDSGGKPLPGGSPVLIRDEIKGIYLLYTEGHLFSSPDLMEWTDLGAPEYTVPAAVREFLGEDYTVSPAFGASRARSEIRLYISAKNGTGDSCIFVAGSRDGCSPYTGRLPVLYSRAGEPEAVCPSIAMEKTGGFENEHVLIYGSGETGIRALHLNPRNGLAHVTGFGEVLARRPSWLGCSVGSSCAVYDPDRKWYYLFYTAGNGWDSQIRVGRSRSVYGPYLDAAGADLADIDDYDASRGTTVLSGYRLDSSAGYAAFSHPSVLRTEDGNWFMACEASVYSGCKGKPQSETQIRRILFTSDEWPVVSPELYAGETDQQVSLEDLVGHYEFLKFTPQAASGVRIPVALDFLTPAMQGVSSTRNDWAFVIPDHEEGRVELGGSMRGSWKVLDDGTVRISYPTYQENYRVTPVWDHELQEASFALVGLDTLGRVCWAKKADLPKSPF